ncbi:podocalyxin [Falco biarmicus]|uniref:podocalyxin n=1 Tax=Falco biarmicus TaxID=345155 RepID=UPI0024BC78A0|nr:podocalyxin [Falco biarmicus]
MRAPLLLPLLLLGVSSENVTTSANPGQHGQIITATSKTQGTTPTSNSGNSPSHSTMSPATAQGTTSASKPGNPPTSPVIPLITVQGATPTSNPGHQPSTPTTSPAAVQGTTTTNSLGNPLPTHMMSSHPSQQVSSSARSGALTTTLAVLQGSSSTAQQKATPPASLGSSAATTSASPILPHMSGLPATSGGLGTAVASSPGVEAQGKQPSDQLTSTTASTGVPGSNLSPGVKDHGVSSTTVAKQPHSSSSSPAQGLPFSTRPGSINTSTHFSGYMSPTTSKASLSLSPSSMNASEAATTPTPGADQRSHDTGSASTKPASTDRSLASTHPSAPAPGDQTTSSSPGHQHPNTSFQNEVICKDQVQNNWPTIHLREAKTCAEWRTASINISFFESFCSTGQHVFNASRETCTVMLTSHKPHSQHWAVQAVVHLPLDPEKVLEELKEKKDKLEELGITNITYDKMEREMIINDEFSTPLIITIVTLAGSLLLIAAIYGCCHQRFSQKKDQHIHPDVPGFDDGHVALIFNQRLTEELQTMENGYHDNPTLEVMETSSEMQEKKVNLNGELGDSWIVPLDTLMKEDLEEEEDTHL